MSDNEGSPADYQDPNIEVDEELLDEFHNLGIEEVAIKKELDKIVQSVKEKEVLPDIVAELIVSKKINIMILDLYDYEKGYQISFRKFGDAKEIFHGEYVYGVSLIEYIRDGQVPYEVFDNIYNYGFQIFYDGYIVCQLRIHFGQVDCTRSHFVLLKHTIQTIDGQCNMNLKNSSLDLDTERARLIEYYSPDLCLDPDPVVSEIVAANELNQHPFLTPYLKHVIQTEKAQREKGVIEKHKNLLSDLKIASTSRKVFKPEDWNIRLKDPNPEEAELSKSASNLEVIYTIKNYLSDRKICFPDKESFTGFQVEIENFVFEYDGCTTKENVARITDKLCISVIDDKEYFYGGYKLDDRMKDYVPFYWWPIGGRAKLDIYVKAVAEEEMKLRLFCGALRISHHRLFDERVEFADGIAKIVRRKLDEPVRAVVQEISASSCPDDDDDEDEKMDEN